MILLSKSVIKFSTSQEVRQERLRIKWVTFGPEPYDGWLYGKFDPATKKFVGNKVAYIYHDLQTVIIGKFVNDELQYGRPAKVKAYRYLENNFSFFRREINEI